ncbi:hypothetical protein CRM22_004184 [Opisthorchis felineus]|uniref:CWH43-like N-terminal domain-containing protein n=1 Tax=Opisthorchis felineus TaxID=147828 RepID=A0A4S2LXG2_OPIFE|nr:hypothetical protein CRM22_004184 [Opisthorchis felineus]
MSSFPLHYFPIAFCVIMVLNVIVSYAISTAFGDSSALFPYISDTGSIPPESCVFGLFLNVGTFFGCLSVYAWYGHQMDRLTKLASPKTHIMHAYFSLAFGLAAVFGLCIVGNFQESSLFSIHLTGAFMLFGCSSVYITLCSHASRKHLSSPRWLWVLRAVLAAICVMSFASMSAFITLCSGIRKLPPKKWNPDDDRYVYHALSVTFEWLMTFAVLSHFLTMAYELQDYKLSPLRVRYRYVPTTLET